MKPLKEKLISRKLVPPEDLRELKERGNKVKEELYPPFFVGQVGAAPEFIRGEPIADQTTPEGRAMLDHTRGFFEKITGARPTYYLASGTGGGEGPIRVNATYNQKQGVFHVLWNGSFSHRMLLQAEDAGANIKALRVPYGGVPTKQQIKAHFKEHAGSGDTIALTHLETSTGAENNVNALIRQISSIYRKKKLDAPVFIIDATSSRGITLDSLRAGLPKGKELKVTVYMGTVKPPITNYAHYALVYSTTEAEEEMKKRYAKFEEEKAKDEKTLGHGVAGTGYYFKHPVEQKTQEETGRPRFTHAVQASVGMDEGMARTIEQGRGLPARNIKEAFSNGCKVLDEKRKLLQDYYLKALGALGFEHFPSPDARSSMMLALVRPKWLEDAQELLKASRKKYGVHDQVGYAGQAKWEETTHDRVKSEKDIIRATMYNPWNMDREFEKTNAIVRTAFSLASKKLSSNKIKKAGDKINKAKEKALKSWEQMKLRYNPPA